MSRTRDFYEAEKARQTALIESGFFDADEQGYGSFIGKTLPFILQHRIRNLYAPIRSEALAYFRDNHIGWWGGKYPTGHVLSSQIACLNHLMPLRKDPDAVLALINGVRNQFKAVLPLPCDSDESYIAFEAVSKVDYLNEDGPTRGANCTSVDALIYAVDNNDERWLIPIEWKYTESYDDGKSGDKSNEGITFRKDPDPTKKPKGLVRLERYSQLIQNSRQLKPLKKLQGSIYFFEPFYQLMRQTLLAEQIVENKAVEDVKAEHFLHLHIVPTDDIDLLDKKYSPANGANMEDAWRACITDQSKYQIIDPQNLMRPIKDMYPQLWNYLAKRYFNLLEQ